MQQRADVPIWLASASNGTISVVSLAILLPAELRLGAIMASATTTGTNSLFNMPLGSLRLPTLLIANAQDSCFLSPPGTQASLLGALTSAPAKESNSLSGGVQRGSILAIRDIMNSRAWMPNSLPQSWVLSQSTMARLRRRERRPPTSTSTASPVRGTSLRPADRVSRSKCFPINPPGGVRRL